MKASLQHTSFSSIIFTLEKNTSLKYKMSLVVCSNQDSDATTITTAQNIFKPFSFRNALSSTYTIPKNAQVALQSCKYNLDGTIPLSGGDQIVYQYYGQEGDVDQPLRDESASVPIRTPIFQGTKGTIEEVNATSLAVAIEKSFNANIFHPNLRDLVTCEVARDATTSEFAGYKISYGQYSDATTEIPADNTVIDQLSDDIFLDGSYDNFEYEEGNFISDNGQDAPSVGVLASKPLSAQNGFFIANFSDPNDNDVDWGIGLSRYVYTSRDVGLPNDPRQVPYWRSAEGALGDTQPKHTFFFDYIVCRKEGKLRVYQSVRDSEAEAGGSFEYIMPRELEYSYMETIDYPYDIDTNAAGYDNVKWVLSGQRLSVSMVNSGTGAEDVLFEYSAEVDFNTDIPACVSQAKWNLYPLLYIATGGYGIFVEEYHPCLNVLTTAKTHMENDQDEKISWFNSLELAETLQQSFYLEMAEWNDVSNTQKWYNYFEWAAVLTGANPAIDLENILIMKPSTLYEPSLGANTEKLLGYENLSPFMDYTYEGGGGELTRIFTSETVPKLLASRSMFVRLDNMTQQSVNARMGNRSSIISHLPRFDGQVETGRIFHEPKNLVFLDLNNAQPMPVTSFDISFVYSNEQYVTALTGQSVVCLYFREKPEQKIQQV